MTRGAKVGLKTKLGTVVPIYKYIIFDAFHPGFHCILMFLSARILPKLTVFTELTLVLSSFDTFTLTMWATVFFVIRVPRVRTKLATLGSK